MFSFVLALVYELIYFIGILTNRQLIAGRALVICEIVIAIIILSITIYSTLEFSRDIFVILALVCGYILSALFIVTAYEG